MRALMVGLFAGFGLAALRAPLGADLFQLPAVSASTAYGYRAAALGVVALGLLFAGRPLLERPRPGRLLLGVALGFAYRGLVFEAEPVDLALFVAAIVALYGLPSLRASQGQRAAALLHGLVAAGLGVVVLLCSRAERPMPTFAFGVLLALAIALVARLGPRAARAEGEAAPSPMEQPPRGELSGLALGGAGAAIALEGVARHLRLLGGGLAEDDALFGSLLLGFALIGAFAFAQAMAEPGARRLGRGLLLCATALAGFASMRAIGSLASSVGLDRYLRGTSHVLPEGLVGPLLHGTLGYDLAIAAPILALPGVLLGAALRALRGPIELAAALLGAAVGHVMVPTLLAFQLGPDELGGLEVVREGFSAELIPTGAKLAALAGLFALALGGGRGRRGTIVAAALVAGAGALAFVLPAPRTTIAAPWARRPALPTFVLDTPQGLLTIEETGGGIEQVTLDRRPLAPPQIDAALDRSEIEAAVRLVDPALVPDEGLRVLLVGQLTPGRATTLVGLGAQLVDRTGSWFEAMPVLESRLSAGEVPVAGEVLRPAEAGRRLAAGDYDLLLVPSVPGDAPSLGGLGFPIGPDGNAPTDTLAVVWLDGRAQLASLELPERVIAVIAALDDLALGVVYGAGSLDGVGGERAGVYASGPVASRPDPLETLRAPPADRERANHAAIARRLSGGNPDGPEGRLWRGLALFLDAQKRSSHFESAAAQTECPEESLALWRDMALASEVLPELPRTVLQATATLLRGKRWVEEIQDYLGPVAERFFPWTRLENTLAYSDLELLDPERTVARVEALTLAGAADAESYRLLGEGLAQSGREAEACEAFWRSLELVPGDRHVRRRLAIQLVRSGDPEGQPMVRDLLLEEPEDPELERYLEPGPYPELPRGAPRESRHHDH